MLYLNHFLRLSKKNLEADTKEEKIEAIDKIRGSNQEETQKSINAKQQEIQNNINPTKELTKDSFKRKQADEENDFSEKKKPQVNFGRKKIRERKVTIVTALSDNDERTRSLAAYKRAKQKTKKTKNEGESTKKLVRDVYIPESITVKELAIRMAEKSGDVIKSLMKMGMMATINESLDADTAELISY